MGKKGEESKKRILATAFKLFAMQPYDKVTFAKICDDSGISRGGVTNHFTKKEAIFFEVVNFFLFDKHALSKNFTKRDGTFLDFINSYIDWIGSTKKQFAAMGIINMHRALLNITLSAMYFFPEFDDKATEWERNEIDTWMEILHHSVENGELKSDIDLELVANLYKNVYFGTFYAGLIIPDGVDLPLIRKSFLLFYDCIKA